MCSTSNRLVIFLCYNSNSDLNFLGQAYMGIKNDLQKKYIGISVDCSYIDLFFLQNAIDTFHNLYYDYWDPITKFWLGSLKWDTPFSPKISQFFLLKLFISYGQTIKCLTHRLVCMIWWLADNGIFVLSSLYL